ncbi:MAG: amino acid--[acyl-carrier-protein] ligase [Solirubrobacterales bacterium]|nr:amino acid--[acyl-carrier-protein] ligase [Solirubrobacterales bacterium]
MTPTTAPTPRQTALLAQLLATGLLIDSGVPGVYGRGAAFEEIRLAVDRLIDSVAAGDDAEALRFPPVLPRRHLETSGYLASFPHLAGTIFAFEGDEQDAAAQARDADAHARWDRHQQMTDVVLTPAACYPVYPAIAARGPLPPHGVCIDAGGAYVFRCEPSQDPARMQMFHQREIVRLGEPETVAAWRNVWRERCMTLLDDLGLEPATDVASDPFFGRQGRMLATSQRQQALKFEVSVAIAGDEPTAVASFNYHRDHFAERFGILAQTGGAVHTACLGFGLERITLGLLAAHGLDRGAWPPGVRLRLGLS